MTVALRKLKEEGLTRFRTYLAERRAGAVGKPPDALDPAITAEVVPRVELDADARFETKRALGEYLWNALSDLRGQPVLDSDPGTWAWVCLLYFGQMCPDGESPYTDEYYVPLFDRKRYRHLVRTPYELFGRHGDVAALPLSLMVSEHGELSEQLLSRVELYRNTGFFRAVAALYLAASPTGAIKVKRGALSRNKPGTLRRFMKVFRQFALTYDLQGMEPGRILSIMPPEFARFVS